MGRAATDIAYIGGAAKRVSRTTKRTLGLLKSCAVTASRSAWHVAAFVRDEHGRRFVFSSVESSKTTQFARSSLQHFDAAAGDLYALAEDVEDARTALTYKTLTSAMTGRTLPADVGLGGDDTFPAPTIGGGGGGGGSEDDDDDDDGTRGAIALTVIQGRAARVTSSQRRACSLLKNALIVASIARWQVLVIVQDETGRRLVTSDGLDAPALFVAECTTQFRKAHDIYYETNSLKDARALLSIIDILADNHARALGFLPAAAPPPAALPVAPPLAASPLAAPPPAAPPLAIPPLAVPPAAVASPPVALPPVAVAPLKKRKAAVARVVVEEDDDDDFAPTVPLKKSKAVVPALRVASPQRVVLVFGRRPPGQNYVSSTSTSVSSATTPPLVATTSLVATTTSLVATTSSKTTKTTPARVVKVAMPGSTLPSRRLSFAQLLRTPPQPSVISYALDVHELPLRHSAGTTFKPMHLMNGLVQLGLGGGGGRGGGGGGGGRGMERRDANDDMLDEMLGMF